MFRLKEIIKEAKKNKEIHSSSELSREIWKDSNPKSAYTNLNNLVKGKSKKIDIDLIPFLCQKFNVTADYLFGLSEKKNNKEFKANAIEKAEALLETIKTF